MSVEQTDLSALSKYSVAAVAAHTNVPVPARRWKTRVLLPAAILLSFTGVFLYALRDSLGTAVRVKPIAVIAKSAAGGGASGIVAQAAGWVEPDPYPFYASALTDGIVKEVPVLEGQRVKADDVLARLIDDDAKLALGEVEAEFQHHLHDVCEYEASVKSAQTEIDNPVERTRAVKAAAAMLDQNKADLAANVAEARVEAAKAAELEEQYRREKIASDAGAFPEGSTVLTALKLETQRATLKLTEAKRPALDAKIKQQEAELAAARDNLKLRITETRELEIANAKLAGELKTVDTVRVRLAMAKLRLARTEIRAPRDGMIMERLTEPGAKLYVNMNEKNSAQVVKLYDPSKLQVRVDVPLADAAKVGAGQRARISVEVLRDVVFEGTVTRVLHQADISKNTLQFKVAIDSPREELKPEMLARVQFLAMEKPGAKNAEPSLRVFAPENLIHGTGMQSYTWIIDKGRSVAIRRAVMPGQIKDNGWIEITEGLQPGDALIDGDTLGVKDGQRVTVAEDAPMPAPSMPPAEDPHKDHKK